MIFGVNTSPFAGKEGTFCTSQQIRERLTRELDNDVSLQIEDAPTGGWAVSGRGELHLAIFIERLRREGYEFEVSRPHVILKKEAGRTLAPYDQVFIEVPEEHVGVVMQKLGSQNGQLSDMSTEKGISYLTFVIPTQGLFGYRSQFLTDTRGRGILHSTFLHYAPDPSTWRERDRGSLVAHETGKTTLYGLLNAQERGTLFYEPGASIYRGQVVGQNARSGDIAVNVCKEKKLSNVRAKNEGVEAHLEPPRPLSLEEALEYIADDELVEVTPQHVRVRKVILDPAAHRRKQMGIKS